jgi:hypothetical protein
MEPHSLRLVDDRWYAWEMFPGYGGEFVPYRSPIFVQKVEPLKSGAGVLRLQFVNIGYAEGVQDFDVRMQVIGRTEAFIVAHLVYDDPELDRWVVIGEISFRWMEESGWAKAIGGPETSRFDVQRTLTEWWFRK